VETAFRLPVTSVETACGISSDISASPKEFSQVLTSVFFHAWARQTYICTLIAALDQAKIGIDFKIHQGQGCQMAYFQTKHPDLGKFWRVLQWKMLLYYMAFWSRYFIAMGVF
jgi:hypothetical protein